MGFGVAACTAADSEDLEFRAPLPLTDDAEAPSAEAVLERTIAFMSGLDNIAFDALVTFEVVQENGQTLHFDRVQRMAMARPDRLFWTTVRDDARIDSVWFDQGTFTMLKRPQDVYGQVQVSSTIDEMVDDLADDYNIVVPFQDLLAGRARELLIETPESSWYVGESWVMGVWTHHVALRNEDVDFQLWIQKDGDPLPLRIAIDWKNEEGSPTYVARFRKWIISPSFDDSDFVFNPPSDARQVEISPAMPLQEEY
jgi:hypothetical protein